VYNDEGFAGGDLTAYVESVAIAKVAGNLRGEKIAPIKS
jgi:hypothetical protein